MSEPYASRAPSTPAVPSNAASPARNRNESLAAARLTTGANGGPPPSPSQRPVPVDPVVDASRERIEAFTRLLIGGALEASDEVWLRLRLWQEQARSATPQARPETPTDWLRFALVGLVFEAEEWVPARLRRMQRASAHTTQRLMNRVSPVGRRMAVGPLRPLRGRLDNLAAQLHGARERWTARGRFEERQGRLVARHAVTSLVDEVMDHLAHDPRIQDLIKQQGAGLATTAVESARERTQSADDWVERMVHGVFKRPAHEQPGDSPRSPPPVEASHSG
jgi:hypothetical protein